MNGIWWTTLRRHERVFDSGEPGFLAKTRRAAKDLGQNVVQEEDLQCDFPSKG